MAVARSINWLWHNPDTISVLFWIPWSMCLLSLINACSRILDIGINTEVRHRVVLLWSTVSLSWSENVSQLFFSKGEVILLVQDLFINTEVWHRVVHLDLLAIRFWVQILGNFSEGRGDWIRF